MCIRDSIKNANISLRVTKNQVLGNPVLLNTVAEAMHSSAEPGLLFWDQIINESPADCYKDYGYKTVGTNPCGELPLNSYGQCLLLHLNLISYVDKPFTKDAEFKFEELAKDAYDAQRVLDDLVDVELEKIDQIIKKIMLDKEPNEVKLTELNLWRQIRSVMSDGRRTGLGHLGMADVFAAMGMRYASDEAIKLGVEIQKEISINSYKSSIIMAKERGSFSIFNHNKEFDHIFINRILLELDDDGLISDTYAKHGRRNISNLTIAPTGSLAIISEVSAGIEPVYELKYERIVNLGSEKTFTVFHPMFKRWYEINGDKFEFGVKKIEDLNSEEFNTIKDVSPYSGSTTYEINPLAKIKFQGAIQQYIDHSISITHNVKGNTSVKQIKDMINLASKEGCKGFTLFREGSISGILSRIKDDKKAASKFIQKDAIRRPIVLHADVKVTSISGEKFAVVIGLLDNKIYEVFCFKPSNEEIKAFKKPKACFTLSKQESKKYNLSIGPRNSLGGINVQAMIRHIGSKSDPDVEIISRLISISLRHGVDITYIYEQIIKPEASINNAAKAIARMFKSYISNEKISRKKLICPECNVGTLVFAEGCLKCNTCGFSKC
jgi:ribonucleoside-diphosphate reductase alpha chain